MSLRRRFRTLFRRDRVEADMAEEMRFHLEQRAAELAQDGLAAEEARLAAQRRFGNTASIQEHARDAFGWGALQRFATDLGQAARQLARSPGFSLLAVATLALGIGANTSMFNVVNGIMLKPTPYRDPGQLERLYRTTPQDADGEFSAADYRDLVQARAGYGDICAFEVGDASLSDPGHPAEMAHAVRVSVNFFSLLGIQPERGRDFQAGEDAPGRDRIVVLSQRTWRSRFGGRADVIGKKIRLDGEPHQIVGVLPESFNDWRHLGWVDLFRPLALTPGQLADRQHWMIRLMGRRATGVTPVEAAGVIRNLGVRQAAAYPEANAGAEWRTMPLQEVVVGKSGAESLTMLIGLSGFVLLIACSNLANLLLARTMARAREFAVRAALGASRLQLLRPLVAESLVLSLAGGLGAVLVALWTGDWLRTRSTGDNGEQVVFALDWHVLGWALAASLVTAVAFGLAPALFALRLNLNDTLKSGGRGATGGRGHQRFRQLLIVGQFALAMVLLVGAGLFIRGLDELNNRRAGWDSTHLVTGTVLLPAAKYSDDAKITAFDRLVMERLRALPGVASASLASFTPFFNWDDIRKFLVEGRDRPEPGREPAAVVNAVSPEYFATVGTRVLAGRVFGDRDTPASTKAYIVSESTARALFDTTEVIGRRLATAEGDNPQWGEIVGVVGDVQSVMAEPLVVNHQVYVALAQEPRRLTEIAVRTTGAAPVALVDGIRGAMAELDPDLPVRDLRDADSRIRRNNYQLDVMRDMLTAFAVLGLGLASLGIYGVIARTMAQRTTEFAIRLALGAKVGDLTRLVLVSGVKLALVGSALGLVGALGVAKLLSSGFPGLRFGSGWILAGVTVLLVVVALVASWLPARRVAKLDPLQALRAD